MFNLKNNSSEFDKNISIEGKKCRKNGISYSTFSPSSTSSSFCIEQELPDKHGQQIRQDHIDEHVQLVPMGTRIELNEQYLMKRNIYISYAIVKNAQIWADVIRPVNIVKQCRCDKAEKENFKVNAKVKKVSKVKVILPKIERRQSGLDFIRSLMHDPFESAKQKNDGIARNIQHQSSLNLSFEEFVTDSNLVGDIYSILYPTPYIYWLLQHQARPWPSKRSLFSLMVSDCLCVRLYVRTSIWRIRPHFNTNTKTRDNATWGLMVH